MVAEAAPKLPEVEDHVIEETRIAPAARAWSWLWPKLAAVALFFAVWQVVVWSGWKPDYVLPGPVPVFQRLGQDLGQPGFYNGVGATLRRALIGYSIAVLIGSALGLLVARVPIVRKAVGHAILGLQSMPSIAWFPLAILLFQLTEGAILFVTHNAREAVLLGDRVLVFTSRPGRVAHEIQVDLPRPRSLGSPELAVFAGRITERLKQETRLHGG